MSVRPARNFPIDLYLLMDLSFSMRDDLDNLKALGASLGEEERVGKEGVREGGREGGREGRRRREEA